MKFQLFGYKLFAGIRKELAPNSLGVLSIIPGTDNEHVIMLDFDCEHTDAELSKLQENLRLLMKKHIISSFRIFETRGGYHALSSDSAGYSEMIGIMNESGCDKYHMCQAIIRPEKACTIRLYSQNKQKYSKYLTTLKSEHVSAWRRKRSVAHEYLFGILANEDELLAGVNEAVLATTCAPLVWYHHNRTAHDEVKNHE